MLFGLIMKEINLNGHWMESVVADNNKNTQGNENTCVQSTLYDQFNTTFLNHKNNNILIIGTDSNRRHKFALHNIKCPSS